MAGTDPNTCSSTWVGRSRSECFVLQWTTVAMAKLKGNVWFPSALSNATFQSDLPYSGLPLGMFPLVRSRKKRCRKSLQMISLSVLNYTYYKLHKITMRNNRTRRNGHTRPPQRFASLYKEPQGIAVPLIIGQEICNKSSYCWR
jgi:hypothetical protein